VTGKFYILDLARGSCLGHFLVMYRTRRWYEVYISPAKSRILIRPDNYRRIVILPDIYMVQNLTLTRGSGVTSVMAIPPYLQGHVMTFNPLLGEDCVIGALGTRLEVRCCHGDWPVQDFADLDLPADIQQIRCSGTGGFLALRCVHPVHSREYITNIVAIVSFPQVNIYNMNVNV
jgi:hypothetical protein